MRRRYVGAFFCVFLIKKPIKNEKIGEIMSNIILIFVQMYLLTSICCVQSWINKCKHGLSTNINN